MRTIHIEASKEYDVLIGSGLLKDCEKHIEKIKGRAQKAVIISDDNVFSIYGDMLKAALQRCGLETLEFVFEHGEANKNLITYGEALEYMCSMHVTRSDLIFALGGGVVGDLAGFAAATYQRGIRYVQIPTTLLAAVDSSVGGKTAVDLKNGKNQAGCFYQPSLVICDTDTLETLPEDEYRCGCAEVIKYGMIADKELFVSISEKPVRENYEDIIGRCIEIKRDIVQKDEFDTGVRMLLNFGHTFGHAAESCSDFSITHGQGVAMGMSVITKSAVKSGICDQSISDKLDSLIRQYFLPTAIPYDLSEMMRFVLSDKKAASDRINIILPVRIGECIIKPVSREELKAHMMNGGIK